VGRLQALTSLSNEELRRPLGDGWTVAAKLAHLAYWEARQVGALEVWQRHGLPPAWWTLPEADAINAARLPLWLTLPPREALEQAIAAAATLERLMAALPAAALAQLPPRRRVHTAHRGDHLDEIERALGQA